MQFGVRFIAFIFALSFEIDPFAQDALRSTTLGTAVLKTVLVVPVAEEAGWVEVVVTMSPARVVSLSDFRDGKGGWDLLHDQFVMLVIAKADRAGIRFHFFNIQRVDCQEVECKLAVACGKIGELLDCILFVFVLRFEENVQFLP